ncbi:MAG: hypothetical protein QOG04_1915 [Actinomycetota bacterium]|jgi:hypothetical protein|nr:hypothetical protein [Actinomycetota bacterium]
MRTTIVRATGCLLGIVMILGLSACGDGGSGETTTAGDSKRYCELVAQLQEAGNEAYGEVSADPNATEEDYIAASKDFYESNQETFDELAQVAPAEINDDVQTLVDSIRGQAGHGPEIPTDEASPAEARIQTYESENC